MYTQLGPRASRATSNQQDSIHSSMLSSTQVYYIQVYASMLKDSIVHSSRTFKQDSIQLLSLSLSVRVVKVEPKGAAEEAESHPHRVCQLRVHRRPDLALAHPTRLAPEG